MHTQAEVDAKKDELWQKYLAEQAVLAMPDWHQNALTILSGVSIACGVLAAFAVTFMPHVKGDLIVLLLVTGTFSFAFSIPYLLGRWILSASYKRDYQKALTQVRIDYLVD